jgi:ppGpp synthetase/RelA/SpoT-type nucleotidyltranferase
MENQIKKILDDYKTSRPIYEEFCFTIYKLISSLLDDKGYKYQALYRIKEINKLEEKLYRKKNEGKIYNSLNEIEDLAGIRIIFYLESDKEKFIKDVKNEISGNIEITETKKKSGYEAIHIILSLGEKRVELAEYKKYKNLKCEMQITSILHHAWAEIEHDLIYKDANKLKLADPKKYNSVQLKLNKILQHHIKKASTEFEKILKLITKNKK